MKKIILGLALIASPVLAESTDLPFGYASIGTAFKLTSTTSVNYTSTSQVVTFTSATTAGTYRFICTTDCNLNLASPSTTTPTATTSNTYLPSGAAEYFVLGPRTNIAVIRNTSDGVLYIGKTGR